MTDHTHYLYQALEQPVGICLRTAQPEKAIALLSKARDDAQDNELKVLRVCKSRHYPDHEVWILRKRAQLLVKQEPAPHG